MTNLLTNARNRNKIKHDILFLSPDWAAEVSKVSQQNITTEIQSKSWGKSCLRSPKSSICGNNYNECQCFRCVSGWAAPWWRRRTLRRCRGRRGRWRRTVPTTWRAWSRPRRWIDKAEYVEWGKTGRTWMRSTQTDQWPWYTPAELYRRNQSSKTLKRLSLSLQSWKLINAALSSCNPRYRVTVLLVKPNFCLFASDYILKIYLSRK